MLAACCLGGKTPKWVTVNFVYPNSEGSCESVNCTDSPEHSLLDNAISTKNSFPGSFMVSIYVKK